MQTLQCQSCVREVGEVHHPALPKDGSAIDSLPALIGLVAGGDTQAFRRIHALQAARLTAAALRITHERALAADAVQEGFLQLWQNAHRFDAARGGAEAWLLRLVCYRAIDIIRRRAHETTECVMADTIDDSQDSLTALSEKCDSHILLACLRCLQPRRRQIVLLSFVDGRSHLDIARALHMPLGTVKCTLRRSLLTLRKCLEDRHGTGKCSSSSCATT